MEAIRTYTRKRLKLKKEKFVMNFHHEVYWRCGLKLGLHIALLPGLVYLAVVWGIKLFKALEYNYLCDQDSC